MAGDSAIRELKLLGAVLERFNSVEGRLASIIALYVGAKDSRHEFMQSRVLHNSIVSYGSKVKLVLAISRDVGGPQFDRNKLHEFGNIRNSFAHGRIATAKRVNPNPQRSSAKELLIVESIKGDGSVHEMRRGDAVSTFTAIFEEIVPQLRQLEELVRGVVL